MFCAFTRAAALLRFVDSELSVQAKTAERPTAAHIRKLRQDVRAISREVDRTRLPLTADGTHENRRDA
jgi:hypothetical protein